MSLPVTRALGGAGRLASTCRVVLAAWTVSSLLPGLAAACAVCAGQDEGEVRAAFIGSTAFMTFLPLLLLGGLALWLRKRLREVAEEEAREASSPPDTQAGPVGKVSPLVR